MSFAIARQRALQNGALALFGELCTFTRRAGTELTIKVKVTHRQSGTQSDGRRHAGPQRGNTVDENEVIECLVSRDPTYVNDAGECLALVEKPDPAETLVRSASIDSDRRPFQFCGEIVFEGDQHAVYVFQRPRRFVQGGGR